MELTVTGLPQSADRTLLHALRLAERQAGYPCVGFKMQNGATTVRFTVPYELKDDTQLVVTAVERRPRGRASVVMRTV